MNKVIKNLVFSVFFLIILSIISIVVILWTYSNELPDYKFLKNYKPPVSSKLYSGEGELVIDFATEKRIFIPYNSIPKIVSQHERYKYTDVQIPVLEYKYVI